MKVSPHCTQGLGNVSADRRLSPQHFREHQRPDEVGLTLKVPLQTSQVAVERRPQSGQYFCRLEVGWNEDPQVTHDLDWVLTDAVMDPG